MRVNKGKRTYTDKDSAYSSQIALIPHMRADIEYTFQENSEAASALSLKERIQHALACSSTSRHLPLILNTHHCLLTVMLSCSLSRMTPGIPLSSLIIATCFDTASATIFSGGSVTHRQLVPTGFFKCRQQNVHLQKIYKRGKTRNRQYA